MKKLLCLVAFIFSLSAPCLATIYINNQTLGSTSSATTYTNETIDVTGYLRLIGTITFNSCTFIMNTNSEILMTEPASVIGPPPNGNTSFVNNIVTISGCTLDRSGSSGTWKGINVAYNSFLNFQSNSILQHAVIGINCAYGSFPSITQCTIAYCQNGLNIPNLDTRFNTHPNAYTSWRAFYGNLITNCTLNGFSISNIKQNINIGKSSQNENNFSYCSTGLNILNSNVIITLSNFLNNGTGVNIESSTGNRFPYKCEISGAGSTNYTFYQNSYKDICAIGNYQQLIVKNCRFYMPTSFGVYITNLTYGFFNIDNNDFISTNKTNGIPIWVSNSLSLRDNPTSRYYPTSIRYNKFKFNYAYNYLIYLSNISSIKNVSIAVRDNTVRAVNNSDPCSHTGCCFHFETCQDIWVGYNDLKLSGTGALYGLHHSLGVGTGGIGIQTNNIVCSSPTSRRGIELDGVNNDFVCNNTIENAQDAIKVASACQGLYLGNNIMKMEASAANYASDSPTGLKILGAIKSQTHTGNQWVGGNFLWEAFFGPTLTNSDDKFNRFISRVDNYGTSLKYWPTSTKVNRPGFFRNDPTGSLNLCGLTSENGDPNKYLSDTSFRTSLTTGELWDNDYYFFEYYSKNLDSLVQYDQIDLYDSLSNTNFVDFYNLEHSIMHFYELDSTTINLLSTLQASYDTFSLQLTSIVDTFMQGDTALMYEDSQINHLIDTSNQIADSIQILIQIVDSFRSIKLDSLLSDFSNLNSTNSYDSLYKELYNVLLKRLNNDTLTTSEYGFLFDLSRECPNDYGIITYKANALLNPEDHLEDLLENCPSSIILNSSNLEKLHTSIIYPNPVSDEITIITEHSIEKCYISDIYGKIISKLEMLHSENDKARIKLDDSKLTSGTYFLLLVFSDKVETKKLILKK